MGNTVNPSSSSIRDRTSVLQSDEIDLGALLQTLWRGKWWIAIITALTILIGSYYAFIVAVSQYTAGSVVVLENRQENVANLESVMSGLSGDQATINTEVEVIRSRSLIENLVEQLKLTDDPEFNETLRPISAISVGAFVNWVEKVINGNQSGPLAPTKQQILDETINNVLKGLRVSNLRQSFVFRITAVTETPQKSAAIANTLAELYILDQLEVKFEATEQATEWLTQRVAELQIALESADIAVKDFSTNTDLVSPEVLISLNRQLKDLRDRHINTKANAQMARDLIAQLLASQDEKNFANMAELANDRILTRILGQIETGTIEATDTFSARFSKVIGNAAAEVKRSEGQELALQGSIQDIGMQIENQSAELVKLRQLQREAEASRLIYEYFLGRLKETSVQQGIQQADSRILSKAIPGEKTAPRVSIILALSAMLGMIMGVAVILLREMRQTGIRTAEQLENLSGLTVIGQIPTIPARQRSNVLKYLVDKPNSAAAESIRNLRTSLLLSNIDTPPQIIMSTSSLPGEGKTTQSLALAQNMAGLNQKVLLVEGDIRRRVFSEYFNIKEKRGLLAVLSGEAELKDVVTHMDELGADVLIGENSTTNAADVFSSKKFRAFLKAARKEYDAIIIDTAPVLIVPDARVIGQSVDAIIYTVKWDSTSKTQVREGLRMFETVNLHVAGLVLGQINAKKMKHYGYGGEYGAYGAYGSKYYHN